MKKGISSNILKVIAIVLMILDHIAGYMYNEFDQDTYYLLRSIGRIAMPIFSYLLVQGFYHTKNFKKYVGRIFILATLTQVGLLILGFINYEYFPNYWTGVNNYLNIVYSYFLSLVLISIIDKKEIFKKLNEKQNLIIRLNSVFLIILIYQNLKIEFDYVVPFIILELYGIEKLFMKDNKLLVEQESTKIKKILYISLIFIILFISTFLIGYSAGCKYAMLLATFMIALYNGKRGRNNVFIKYLFYLIFPLQHCILYLLAMFN